MAQNQGGDFVLRIEDIDQSRSRPDWERQIFDDLAWLGIRWETPVLRQSDQADRYTTELERLWNKGFLYPCTCNRRDIQEAISAPQEGIPIGADGIIYPGTCRNKPRPARRPVDTALRLDVGRAAKHMQGLVIDERMFRPGQNHTLNPADFPTLFGDIVLARKDMGTSYHLSVVLDDAKQQITDVIRGEDLFEATSIHLFLQKLMGLSSPIYHHHPLVRDENGKRLAKRDDAKSISAFRDQGLTPEDIRQIVGLA